jgi:peptidoglycan hydrolase-like protein with peptidoglycan-binding domain
MTDQAENLKAINDFFVRTAAITPKAAAVKTDWAAWYSKLGFLDMNVIANIYDEARARRNLFMTSNVANAAEKANVEQWLDNGITSEQMSGKSDKESQAAKDRVKVLQAKLDVQGTTHPTIKQGSSGDAVKEWQKFLGLSPVDGKFGPGTQKATVAWQSSHGLKGDGIVGTQTWGLAMGAKTPLHNDEAVVAKIPAIFSPAPKTIPVTGKVAPKPTAAAVSAAKAAGPKGATTVDKTGAVSGVKPVGESVMPSMQTAAMLPGLGSVNALAKKVPAWAAISGVIATLGLFVFGVKKIKDGEERHQRKHSRPIYY